MFTQSPVEGAIWQYCVSIQDWLATTFLQTVSFRVAVVLWVAFSFIYYVYKASSSLSLQEAIGRFVVVLSLSMLGQALLTAKNDGGFTPVNANGSSWQSSTRLASSNRSRGLDASTNGLFFYVQIHKGASEISRVLSEQISKLFGDKVYNQSPFFFVQTLAKTAASSIDDPQVVSSLNTLFESCADAGSAPVLGAKSTLASVFDMKRRGCAELYSEFQASLYRWASAQSAKSTGALAASASNELSRFFGFTDETTYRNKVIASAMVDYVRARAGDTNVQGINTASLLEPGKGPTDSFGTSYFVHLAHAFSVPGIANTLLRPFTGTNYAMSDARNELAFVYSKMAQFLPPLRGYAKGILALSFVFAACALAFGNVRFMVGWFGMLFLFTVYEPASTLLYQSVMLFSKAQENVEAVNALKNDPLVLSGAAIIDANIASIQAVYFVLQLGLTVLCGWAGMKSFMFSRRLTTASLSSTLTTRVQTLVRMASAAR